MSDYESVVRELILNITKDIDLPAFINLSEKEVKFLFGNEKCYENSDNYIYFDKNKDIYKVICPKTNQELEIW